MREHGQRLFTPKTVLVMLGLLAAFVVLLRLEGRVWSYSHGIGFWSDAWTKSTSQHFLDPYSLSHVLHGVIFYWLLFPLGKRVELPWRFVLALALEIAWELLENSPITIERYRNDTAAFDYMGDSILNALGDTLTASLGFLFAARVPWWASVALFIVFELWGLYLARDNLTLNILMLVWPLEAIKEWQWELSVSSVSSVS